MSFKQTDNNDNNIHLGNYEEFFVLYMDNELSDEQMKMVDAFLLAHPDLQAEFEILASTRLPAEEFSFNKAELFSDHMKLNVVGEDLLLYIDNELPADKAKVVELELASNKDYRLQHSILMQTKLDPTEIIVCPDKKELYRRTEKRIGFQPWMRIAAAAIVIAAMGVLYYANNSTPAGSDPAGNNGVANNASGIKPPRSEKAENKDAVIPQGNELANNGGAAEKPVEKRERAKVVAPLQKETEDDSNELIADNGRQQPTNTDVSDVDAARMSVGTQMVDGATVRTINVSGNNNLLNNLDVTSSVRNPYHITETPDEQGALASNEKKGSVKGFLRKATRMIEKRTGIETTNDDGRLLIGAVALKLK